MVPRALRALLAGAGPEPEPELEPGREAPVVLSGFGPRRPEAPPDTEQQQDEEEEEEEEAEAPGGGAVFGRPPPAARAGAPPGGRRLRAAPLRRLARHLLEAPAGGDGAFVPAFLATYRAFARPADVLGLLLERLDEAAAAAEAAEVQGALSALLCSWLRGYPEDFGAPLGAPLARRLAAALAPGSEAARRLEAARAAPGDGGGDSGDGDGGDGDGGDGDSDGDGGDGGDGDGGAEPLDILLFRAREVAEELTRAEAELFLRLVPYECLGSLWSQRAKKGREGACPTVRATVRQFNRLAGAVVRSCLAGPALRPPQRARLLEKWIRVAEECRALRNFSSLHAIVSALRSSPVHRLRRAWHETAREAQRSYEELSTICSEQDNYSASRRLLFQETPPQPSGAESTPRRQPRRPPEQRPVGVVPYLGTFLRDLVMLDAAMKDELENGYINFEKRRKEFEVLAQVGLLQSVCRGYRLRPQPRVRRWLRALRPLSDAQSHSLSCEIEPPEEPPPAPRPPKPTLVVTRCTEPPDSAETPPGAEQLLSHPAQVTSQEKTPAVVAKALEKHGQDGAAASRFQLVQLLPEGRELPLPPSANVFYAMNGASLDFALRPRRQPPAAAAGTAAGRPARAAAELSATFPKIKATGRKITRALF
ncbi:ral guanine nucleotide dissociation stimulator-like 2 isoform X2 [Rhea pennata]|uniref:ral guanine nucleotide dissociation stimulator-like 2 isoform X2 n=1 Tax=Rhea pennata TaxID=8795 RepID=UPI002E264535